MPKYRKDLTAERLRELLSYDPETGVFHWKIRTSTRVSVGSIAGGPDRKGYIKMVVDKHYYKAHRLAWLYMHGVWPAEQIDHINGIKSDNRIVNLREATNAENQQNLPMNRRNTSGHTGIYWHKQAKKWHAQIAFGGRMRHVGLFSDLSKAIAERAKAKAKHHTFQPTIR